MANDDLKKHIAAFVRDYSIEITPHDTGKLDAIRAELAPDTVVYVAHPPGVPIDDIVTLAGQVGVAGHITIGAGTIATAQSGIPNSVEAGSFISGYPAVPNRDWLKSSAIFRRLPELRKTIADLERRLAELESRLG